MSGEGDDRCKQVVRRPPGDPAGRRKQSSETETETEAEAKTT